MNTPLQDYYHTQAVAAWNKGDIELAERYLAVIRMHNWVPKPALPNPLYRRRASL